jgi:hypothetical protein
LPTYPSLLRRVPGRAPDGVRPAQNAAETLSQAPERVLVCAACFAVVTRASERIVVHDRHEHTFLNPAGYVYRIGCYASAPGAGPFGAPSDDYAWFEGYSWQMAVCLACAEHLGWLFSGAGACFWGLIVDRLRESGSAD